MQRSRLSGLRGRAGVGVVLRALCGRPAGGDEGRALSCAGGSASRGALATRGLRRAGLIKPNGRRTVVERRDRCSRNYSSVDESVASRLAGEIPMLTARGLIRPRRAARAAMDEWQTQDRTERVRWGSTAPLQKLRSPVGARLYLIKPDRPRLIDCYINYFGDSPRHSRPPSLDSVHGYAAVFAAARRGHGRVSTLGAHQSSTERSVVSRQDSMLRS